MKKTVRLIINILFLIIFIFLIRIGKIQLWMGLFLLSIAVSFIFGRIYCGWLCPINTVMSGVAWIKKKLRIKSFPVPKFLRSSWVRWAALGLFLLLFAFTIISGKKLPVLPSMLLIGFTLTLFFPEEAWHCYLCPYGTVLSLSGSRSKYSMTIDAEKCNNCNACVRVCPARAIDKSEKHYINKKDCLVCMKCSEACRQNAIHYK